MKKKKNLKYINKYIKNTDYRFFSRKYYSNISQITLTLLKKKKKSEKIDKNAFCMINIYFLKINSVL